MAQLSSIRRKAQPLFLLASASLISLGTAQSTYVYGSFSGAIYVTPPNLSAASPAVCPADAPVSCSSISQPDYCCPSGNYCAYASNSVIGCCPAGQSCSGTIGGYESTYYQPVTTPYQTTVYGGGGVIIPAGVTTVQPTTVYQSYTTHQYYGNGVYCSTLTENGPGLPTTASAACGTILIVQPAKAEAASHGVRILLYLLHLLAASYLASGC